MHLAYRCCWVAFLALIATDLGLGFPADVRWVWLPAGLALALTFLAGRLAARAPRTAEPAREVEPPVAGRWSAANSPADKVPSHGTHRLAQAYAIDITAEPGPQDPPHPGFAWLWPLVRPARAFPSFGAPVYAVADAVVVRAAGRQRDHLSRTSWPAVLHLLLVEASVRDLAGPDRIIGNHIVLELGDGTYALYGHLKRGSLKVGVGDRVTAGQLIAECGNSGNSTEPHVHFQLMDGPDADTARGLPFTWRGTGVPATGEVFDAGPRP
ncbi:M23 family metallopeptidase [Streptomyces sp. NPDC127106]|uniref:M23 family metallopeptidase n=1 Tax=Streptomyces sp. NPDC127106 TaxID=3345360 RepID=UPI00362FCDC3